MHPYVSVCNCDISVLIIFNVNPLRLYSSSKMLASSIEYYSEFDFHDFRDGFIVTHTHARTHARTHAPKATGIQSVIVSSCPL